LRYWVVQQPPERQTRRALPDQPRAGQQLPRHDADTEHVGSAVEWPRVGLLGGQVSQLALDRADACRWTRSQRGFGNAEVDQLHASIVGQEYVLRAAVAVD